MATETPRHNIERQDGDIEIRRYEPQIVAEVTVDGDRRTAANRAFSPLADYIFAKDGRDGDTIAMTAPVTQSRADQTIAMTAPVTQSANGHGQWTVQFIMPASWTMETLPAPANPAVTLRRKDERRVAVIGFSGRPTHDNVERNETELRTWLAANDLTPSGPAVYGYYDPPFKPGFLRRNEVMIPLD